MLMGLIRQKRDLNGLNTNGLKKSQIMEYYSDRKFTSLMAMSSIGLTILRVNCFFHMEPQIHVA